MQNAEHDTQPPRGLSAAATYRERLSPSLWVLVSAALVGPMTALVFTPVNTTIALVVGALAGLAFVGLLVAGSPVLEVSTDRVRAGRARISPAWLGEPVILRGEQARLARGAHLHAQAWHVIRGGIDAVVVVPVEDPDDPAPNWVLSTRTPDRLAAVLRQSGAGGASRAGAGQAEHSTQIGPSADL